MGSEFLTKPVSRWIAIGALLVMGGFGTPAMAQANGAGKAVSDQPDLVLTTEDDATVHASFFGASAMLPPAVVLVHGAGADRSIWTSFARELAGQGIAVLTLDLRGQGESVENPGDVSARPRPEDQALYPNDIRAAIRFLREREDIDGVRVSVIAATDGATAAAVYSVDDHLLVALGLLSPSLEDGGANVGDAVEGFGARPCLLVAAKGDPASSGAVPVLAERAQGAVETVWADGAARGADLLGSFRVRAAVFEWLNGIYR